MGFRITHVGGSERFPRYTNKYYPIARNDEKSSFRKFSGNRITLVRAGTPIIHHPLSLSVGRCPSADSRSRRATSANNKEHIYVCMSLYRSVNIISLSIYIYIYIQIYMYHVYIHTYMCIYIERETERSRSRYRYT